MISSPVKVYLAKLLSGLRDEHPNFCHKNCTHYGLWDEKVYPYRTYRYIFRSWWMQLNIPYMDHMGVGVFGLYRLPMYGIFNYIWFQESPWYQSPFLDLEDLLNMDIPYLKLTAKAPEQWMVGRWISFPFWGLRPLFRHILVSVYPIWPMRLIYLPTNLPKQKIRLNVGKSTSHIDPIGHAPIFCFKIQNIPTTFSQSDQICQNIFCKIHCE